jgi:hypothetical protein
MARWIKIIFLTLTFCAGVAWYLDYRQRLELPPSHPSSPHYRQYMEKKISDWEARDRELTEQARREQPTRTPTLSPVTQDEGRLAAYATLFDGLVKGIVDLPGGNQLVFGTFSATVDHREIKNGFMVDPGGQVDFITPLPAGLPAPPPAAKENQKQFLLRDGSRAELQSRPKKDLQVSGSNPMELTEVSWLQADGRPRPGWKPPVLDVMGIVAAQSDDDGRLLLVTYTCSDECHTDYFRLVRYRPDGTRDPQFETYTAPGTVRVIAPLKNGAIILGVGGSLIKLDARGQRDEAFTQKFGLGFNGEILAVREEKNQLVVQAQGEGFRREALPGLVQLDPQKKIVKRYALQTLARVLWSGATVMPDGGFILSGTSAEAGEEVAHQAYFSKQGDWLRDTSDI